MNAKLADIIVACLTLHTDYDYLCPPKSRETIKLENRSIAQRFILCNEQIIRTGEGKLCLLN